MFRVSLLSTPKARFQTHRFASSNATKMAPNASETYADLAKRLTDISVLSGVSGLLGWDEQTMMPEGSAAIRGKQKSVLAGIVHARRTDAALGDLITSLQANLEALNPVERAVVRDAARDFKKHTAVPTAMAERAAALESEAMGAWVKARKASDFAQFQPFLEEWVALNREKCRLIDASRLAYDVLLDDYERGMDTQRIAAVLAQVKAGLVPLIRDIKERGTKPDESILAGEWAVDVQAAMCKEIAVELGFDLARGRLDVSVHPFTGGAHPSDVRMTTRFKPDDFSEGLTGAIHETGHAIYEQGRNPEWDGLPVSDALSMGVHESQSLLWERMVALSRPFAAYLAAKLKKFFPTHHERMLAKAGGTEPQLHEALYRALNVLREPSLIRVEADEVTYPMHILIRFEIEQGLMDGSIAVKDVPALWNEKMEAYLGVRPETDAQGCLQDVHWCYGAFGYFPTYSMGAMNATQIFEAAGRALGEETLTAQLARGEFTPLRQWLNENIHRHGSFYPSADELLTVATGKPLDPTIFLAYITKKYKDIYQLP